MYAMKIMSKTTIKENELEEYVYTERKIMIEISHPFLIKAHFVF